MNTEPVKGFRDFTGEDAEKFAEIKKIILKNFEKYNFEPAETPIIEREEFVRGEKSQENDEAISDIFKLKDKGKRNLALRYEFTFQLKRLMNNKKLPYKRYEIGPVFRDEPATANRLRQFTQCDADVVGISSEVPAREESEVLALANDILKELGIEPVILINNRKLLNEILDDLGVKKNKEAVLREIDKFGKISEKEMKTNLKKLKAEKVLEALKQGEDYFNEFESYKEIVSLMDYCRQYGFEVKFSPTIIRGLSYYNGTVFEVKAKGIKETIIAGGSYMFNNVQCTGISFGVERLMAVEKMKMQKDKFLIVSLGEDDAAVRVSAKMRNWGDNVSIYYGKPSKALEYANAYRFTKVIFLGEKEIKARKAKVKDMKSGKESEIKL